MLAARKGQKHPSVDEQKKCARWPPRRVALSRPGFARQYRIFKERDSRFKNHMILEAREVRLRRGDRQKLAARCRLPLTVQRDLIRARFVLLAAQGRSARSIAQEVGVHPRIVSLWRAR